MQMFEGVASGWSEKMNTINGDRILKAQTRWENSFEKKMTNEMRQMFFWGYAYAIEDLTYAIDTKKAIK